MGWAGRAYVVGWVEKQRKDGGRGQDGMSEV